MTINEPQSRFPYANAIEILFTTHLGWDLKSSPEHADILAALWEFRLSLDYGDFDLSRSNHHAKAYPAPLAPKINIF